MTANRTYIGMENAKAVLLHETRTRREDATFTEGMLEHDAIGALYHILFHGNGMDYECYVNAVTAEVLGLLSEPHEEATVYAAACA